MYINKVVGILSACFSATSEEKLSQTTKIVKKENNPLKASILLSS